MAQQVKALTAKPNVLTLIHGTHMVEGENQLLEVLPHMSSSKCVSIPIKKKKGKKSHSLLSIVQVKSRELDCSFKYCCFIC